MADELRRLSGAEEYVAAEIELAEPLDPEQEKSLRDALAELDRTPSIPAISAGKISLCYDPTRTSKKSCSSSSNRPAATRAHRERRSPCYNLASAKCGGPSVPPYSRPRTCRLSRANLNPPNDSAAGNPFVSARNWNFVPRNSGWSNVCRARLFSAPADARSG